MQIIVETQEKKFLITNSQFRVIVNSISNLISIQLNMIFSSNVPQIKFYKCLN